MQQHASTNSGNEAHRETQPFVRDMDPVELSARDILVKKRISKREVMQHIIDSKKRARTPIDDISVRETKMVTQSVLDPPIFNQFQRK